jgi:hypothetical protein
MNNSIPGAGYNRNDVAAPSAQYANSLGEKARELPDLLSRLDSMVSTTQDALSFLEDRLSVVLLPATPAKEVAAPTLASCTQFGGALAQLHSRVVSMRDRLQAISNRLEL